EPWRSPRNPAHRRRVDIFQGPDDGPPTSGDPTKKARLGGAPEIRWTGKTSVRTRLHRLDFLRFGGRLHIVILRFLGRLLELLDRLAEALGERRKFRAAEEEQQDHEDHEQLGHAEAQGASEDDGGSNHGGRTVGWEKDV